MSTVEPGLRPGAVRVRPVLPVPRQPLEPSVEAPVGLLVVDAPRRRARRGSGPRSGVLLVVMGVALVVALGLAGYLWVSADAWRARALDDDAERAQLAVTASALQEQVAALQGDLDASDARVEELAAEKARAADLREAGAQRSSPSSSSGAALTSTAACAASLRSLLEVVLPDPDYDLAAARRLAVSADEDCADAQDARDRLADAVAERS